MWFGIDKVELSASTIAAPGVSMVEVSKCCCIGARLSCLRREDAAVIHAEKEPEVRQMIGVICAEVILFGVALDVGDEVAGGNRPLTLLLAILTPPLAKFVLLGKFCTLDVDQWDIGTNACIVQHASSSFCA